MLVQGDRDVKCPPEDYFPRQTFLWQIKETLASRHKHCQPTTNTSGSGSGQYRIETQQTKYSVLQFTSQLPLLLPTLYLSSDSWWIVSRHKEMLLYTWWIFMKQIRRGWEEVGNFSDCWAHSPWQGSGCNISRILNQTAIVTIVP